jgi:ribosomal protein S21
LCLSRKERQRKKDNNNGFRTSRKAFGVTIEKNTIVGRITGMIQVTKKDSKESNENMLRRFGRKVQQSGILTVVKQSQYFDKPLSKSERRQKAIIRKERKAQKLKKLRLS